MKNIVFFDIDGTLIVGQSQLFLVRYLYKRKRVSSVFLLNIIFWFALYKIGIIRDPESIMKKSFVLLRGWKVKDVKSMFEDFFQKDLRNRINIKTWSKLQKHLSSGDEVVIITNIMEPLAKVIAEFFGVKKLYSSVIETKNGVYTGRIAGEIVYGKEKAKVANTFLKDTPQNVTTIAYADHMSDKNLLEMVDRAVVVSPKKNLYKYARNNSWEIIE